MSSKKSNSNKPKEASKTSQAAQAAPAAAAKAPAPKQPEVDPEVLAAREKLRAKFGNGAAVCLFIIFNISI